MPGFDVIVIGAGPYGLAATAHLRRAGADVRVIGEPMSFWRTMPQGMLLRSNWTATSIAEYRGPLSLDSYCTLTHRHLPLPIPLPRFIEYGEWVQRSVAPDVDRRTVRCLEPKNDRFAVTLKDGETLTARRVVIAAGISPFARRPVEFSGLPADIAAHTGDERDPTRFAGRRVLVVGGGQSALETAALLHEAEANVEVLVRRTPHWLHGGKYHRMLGRLSPLVYAPTDVGPMGLSRIVAAPSVFTRLPRAVQEPMARRSIRPAGAAWLMPRLGDVPINIGRIRVATRVGDGRLRLELDSGPPKVVDHLIYGTGYRVDIRLYDFLPPRVVDAVARVEGYPILGRGLESSIPGLHFLGAPAARSVGPIMRFVSGSWFASRALTQAVVDGPRTNRAFEFLPSET